MKNQVKKLFMVLMLCMATAAICLGCSKEESKEEEKKEITLTFMNGDETLGTLTATAGEKVEGYDKYESLDGFEFLGWYETPSFVEASRKDLSKDTFDEDKTLFGSFKNTSIKEDTRVWTIVGTGTGAALALSNWDNTCEDDMVTFKTTDNTNEFTLTVNLVAGDKFQIIHDHDWADQKGFGLLTEFDESQFESGGGLSGNDDTSDISVKMDGNYTITLITDVDNPALDEVKIVRNGDVNE